LFYYHLLLAIKIPVDFKTLPIYASQSVIENGTFVSVTWRNKVVAAIIIDNCQQLDAGLNPDKILKIQSVIHKPWKQQLFTEWLQLIQWSSRYYHYNLGLMVRMAVPKRILSNKPIKQGVLEQQTQLPLLKQQPLTLTNEQALALKQAEQSQVHLLFGVTGCGKTELYLQRAAQVLNLGMQVLVLVPEIGLTDQLFQSFENRFNVPIYISHSKITDLKRAKIWMSCLQSNAMIVVGTRSAVFLPFNKLGLIVVDEEHDGSYQSQSGGSYNARDVAIYRSQFKNTNVLLGSATPSIINFNRCQIGKMTMSKLTHRVSQSPIVKWQVVDTQDDDSNGVIDSNIESQIQQVLKQQQQVLVLINRRGFAQFVQCANCRNIPMCKQCSVRLHLHKYPNRHLQCHQCGNNYPIPEFCNHCNTSASWKNRGTGTEQIEEKLNAMFAVPILRIDSETTQSKNKKQQLFAAIRSGKPCIIVGTQMMAKGHHFPKITLVCVLDTDQYLLFNDIANLERLAQLLVQVNGRAGRGQYAGRALLQTSYRKHNFLQLILANDYQKVVDYLLTESYRFKLPPFKHIAIIQIVGKTSIKVKQQLTTLMRTIKPHNVQMIGPIPNAIEKRKGLYQWQLLVKSSTRQALHQYLSQAEQAITSDNNFKSHQYRIVVDPHGLE